MRAENKGFRRRRHANAYSLTKTVLTVKGMLQPRQ